MLSPYFCLPTCKLGFYAHGKNDFEESKILDIDLKIILLDHQNNFARTLKLMSNTVTNFDSQ